MAITIKGDLADLDQILGAHAPHLVPAPQPSPTPVGNTLLPPLGGETAIVRGAPPRDPVTPSSNIPNYMVPSRSSALGSTTSQQFTGGATAPKKPGFGHKVLSVLGHIGDAALTTFAPEAAMVVPGTSLNRAWEARGQERHAEAMAGARQKGAEAGLEEAQTAAGLPEAQAAEARGRGALTQEQANLYTQAEQELKDPAVQQAWTTLSDPQADATSRRQAMSTLSQKLGALSMLRGELGGAENIYREGEIGQRTGPSVLVDNGDGTYSRVILSHEGQPMGSFNAPPPAGLVQRENQGFRTVTDAAGNEYLVPVTTRSGPILPGQAAGGSTATAPSAAKRATPGGQAPAQAGGEVASGAIRVGHKPLSQAAKTQIGYIDTTLGTLGQLQQELAGIEQKHKGGQLSDVAAKQALWAAYRAGFASDLSQMMAGVSLTSILGSLAYMKGTRAYLWIKNIQQHLPSATDSYPLMQEKIQNAQMMLPWVKYGTLVTEGVMPPNAKNPVWDSEGNLGMKYADGKVVPMPF